MEVSVVVPARNAELTLGDCLRALELQNLPRPQYEVITVIDGSSDRSETIARSFPVRVLTAKERRGVAATRNVGIRVARGDWVALTDADCIPSRSWLRFLLQAVSGPDSKGRVLGAAGRMVGYQSYSPAARFVDLTSGLDTEQHLKHPIFPFAPSGNVMYRRKALETVDGFNERYYSYETCDLHYRLLRAYGGQFYFEPRAVVLHRHRAKWTDYWSQQLWYGKGFGQFMVDHKDRTNWSVSSELREWGSITRSGLRACRPGPGEQNLLRRGSFVKQLAQHLGFVSTYWNPWERQRWHRNSSKGKRKNQPTLAKRTEPPQNQSIRNAPHRN